MAAKKPMNVGCLVVLTIAGMVGVAIAIHLGIAYYFLQAKFRIREIRTQDAVSSVTASSVLPASKTPASAPSAALAKEALVTSANGAFAHDKSLVLAGYYFPEKPLQAGHFRLAHIDLGDNGDLLKFEKEGQTIPTWTPFMITFEDMTSKEIHSDTGDYRENSPRVFCKSYRITHDVITFEGYDKQVGEVTFTGKIDLAFAAGQSSNSDTPRGDKSVLSGDLTVGSKTFKGVNFDYWAGD